MSTTTDLDHGKYGTYRTRGCRCAACRRAHADKQSEEIRLRQERLEVDPSLAPHGDRSTYENWGCRCDECRAAKAAANAAARRPLAP